MAVIPLVVGLLGPVAAQPSPSRTELWTEGKLEIDLPDRLAIELAQQVRVRPVGPELWEVFTDLEGQAEPLEGLRLDVGLRLGARHLLPGPPEPRHRVHADLRLRARFGPLRLTLRERIQYRLPNPRVTARTTWRSKGTAAVDVGETRLFVATEPFVVLGTLRPFLRIRVEGGIRLDVGRRRWLEAWLRHDEPLSDAEDPRTRVAGLTFEQTLKPRIRRGSRDDG